MRKALIDYRGNFNKINSNLIILLNRMPYPSRFGCWIYRFYLGEKNFYLFFSAIFSINVPSAARPAFSSLGSQA